MDNIELSKEIGKIKKEANHYTKGTNCMLCGKECSSFCNSHSIPRFIIKNIANNGIVYTPLMTKTNIENEVKTKIFQSSPGVEKALTFENICRECDNNVFSNVENEEILMKSFDDRTLNLYALKSLLHEQYTKIKNTNFLNVGASKMHVEDFSNALTFPWAYDAIEASREIEDYKSAMKNNANIKHKVIIDKIIDRRVNFCTACQIALPRSYAGKEINNLFDYSRRLGDIFILVLPLSNEKTRVTMYYRRKYSSYDIVFDEFKSMTIEQQLQAISDLLIIYTENFVFNDKILEIISIADSIISYNIVDDPNLNTYIEAIKFLNKNKINMFNI